MYTGDLRPLKVGYEWVRYNDLFWDDCKASVPGDLTEFHNV